MGLKSHYNQIFEFNRKLDDKFEVEKLPKGLKDYNAITYQGTKVILTGG